MKKSKLKDQVECLKSNIDKLRIRSQRQSVELSEHEDENKNLCAFVDEGNRHLDHLLSENEGLRKELSIAMSSLSSAESALNYKEIRENDIAENTAKIVTNLVLDGNARSK